LNIKAVLFDIGNTLIRALKPEIAYQNIFSSLGIERSTDAIREALEVVEKELTESNYTSNYGKIPYERYWERWDASILKHLGIPQNQISAKEILAKWWNYADCEAYPDANSSLNRLKRMGVKVGLISNAYEEDIDAILDKAGLEKRLFDIIVGVNTIKKAKPQPGIFRYALGKLGVEPEETLFVGDHVDNDYRGARAVGMHALLIEREERSTKDTSNLEKISSLGEIFMIIE